MRKPLLDKSIFKKRRDALKAKASAGDVFVFFSGHAPMRSNDTHYKFRPSSDFFYLTGFEEENAVLVFRPGMTPETTVFVMPKDPVMETWEGFLFGPKLAKDEFGFDEAYETKDFDEKVLPLLTEGDQIFYRLGLYEDIDRKMTSLLNKVLRKKGRKGHPYQTVSDPSSYIAEMRRIKDEDEINIMRESGEIAAKAHIELMKAVRPGMNERELAGLFIYEIMKQGANAEAYNSIVASGNNATTLHYVFNDCECKDGDLVLVDAGAEYKYLASDITRCFPVNGKFSSPQKDMYNEVLKVQKDMVDLVKPGVSFKDLTKVANKALSESLLNLGFFKGSSLDEVLEKEMFKKYYPHGLGHYLGIDVHDIGYYERNNEPNAFKEGVVLTIEPGLYVPENDTEAPKEFKGIGIRIEDDVLVTSSGNEVLTSLVPKEISEIESLRP